MTWQSFTHAWVACEHTKPHAQGQAIPSRPCPSGGKVDVFTQLVVRSVPTTTHAESTGQLHVAPSAHGGSARLQLTTGMQTGTSRLPFDPGSTRCSAEQCVPFLHMPPLLQQY